MTGPELKALRNGARGRRFLTLRVEGDASLIDLHRIVCRNLPANHGGRPLFSFCREDSRMFQRPGKPVGKLLEKGGGGLLQRVRRSFFGGFFHLSLTLTTKP